MFDRIAPVDTVDNLASYPQVSGSYPQGKQTFPQVLFVRRSPTCKSFFVWIFVFFGLLEEFIGLCFAKQTKVSTVSTGPTTATATFYK
jgi:hypothetical protein